MLTNYYADALKQGQKEFRRCTAEGIHPYPTALESILPEGERISGTDMGVIQIPMEHVAGTRTTARALSFSRSMLPLIPAGSEFADKWQERRRPRRRKLSSTVEEHQGHRRRRYSQRK